MSSAEPWRDEFHGEQRQGYFKLIQRIDFGNASLHELAAWHTDRAELEMNYSKALHDLVARYPLTSEQGTLKPALNKYSGSTKLIARSHEKLVELIHAQIQLIRKEQHRLLQTRSEQLQIMEGLNQQLAQEQAEIESIKIDYSEKALQMTKAVEQASRGQTSNMTKKEYEKIQERAIKCKREVDLVEQEYKEAVVRWNAYQDQWEIKLADMADAFQKADLQRVDASKTILTSLVDDQVEFLVNIKSACYTKVRESIAEIDAIADSNGFYKQAPGSAKPTRLAFESLFHKVASVDEIRNSMVPDVEKLNLMKASQEVDAKSPTRAQTKSSLGRIVHTGSNEKIIRKMDSLNSLSKEGKSPANSIQTPPSRKSKFKTPDQFKSLGDIEKALNEPESSPQSPAQDKTTVKDIKFEGPLLLHKDEEPTDLYGVIDTTGKILLLKQKPTDEEREQKCVSMIHALYSLEENLVEISNESSDRFGFVIQLPTKESIHLSTSTEESRKRWITEISDFAWK